MDKRIALIEIIKSLQDKKVGGTVKDKRIIDGKDLDMLIFKATFKIDKNIKYEFRNLLEIFGVLQRSKEKIFYNNDGFYINEKTIETFLKTEGAI